MEMIKWQSGDLLKKKQESERTQGKGNMPNGQDISQITNTIKKYSQITIRVKKEVAEQYKAKCDELGITYGAIL